MAKVVRARRANSVEKRTLSHFVKVSESEREQLKMLAGQLGVSVPRLLVEAALSSSGEGNFSLTERRKIIVELMGEKRLLANISNNLNQVARAANISGVLDEEEFDFLLGRIRKAVQKIDARIVALSL